MLNKQVMKVAIMQIGFAVMSLGIMFVILGFKEKGADSAIDISGVKLDFKSESTGVVVFVVGALMAAAGGLLKNDYATVPIPAFGGIADMRDAVPLDILTKCKEFEDDAVFKQCLATVVDNFSRKEEP